MDEGTERIPATIKQLRLLPPASPLIGGCWKYLVSTLKIASMETSDEKA